MRGERGMRSEVERGEGLREERGEERGMSGEGGGWSGGRKG